MHWRHVSITTTPCWGSRLVALRARVVLAERIGAQPLSQCAGPGQPGGMACRGWSSGCMLGDGARGSATFDPQRAWAPFCDVMCIWSIDNEFPSAYLLDCKQCPRAPWDCIKRGQHRSEGWGPVCRRPHKPLWRCWQDHWGPPAPGRNILWWVYLSP